MRTLAIDLGTKRIGLAQLDSGRYQTYDDSNVMQLAEDIGRSGRERMAKDDLAQLEGKIVDVNAGGLYRVMLDRFRGLLAGSDSRL